MINVLQQLFERDLNRLKEEISLYPDEALLWKTTGGISNSAGNLCLHLIGNLNHFIGATLGNTGYIRERDKEFSNKNVPVDEMNRQIDDVMQVVNTTLNQLNEDDLKKDFPIAFFQENLSTGYFLAHLTTHLNYHLGQINYHRRLLV
ncbi:MAG: DinB family protein [Flavobacteriales bacterium]|nr:DinB family protein [Flavobacteriales bacterium]